MKVRIRLTAVAAVVAASMLAPAEPEFVLRSHHGTKVTRSLGNRRGRPRKFNRPARAVTLTLPEDTIATLKGIDRDISRAVVRAVEPLAGDAPRALAELATFGGRSVIVVPPVRALKDRTGADLVPLPDGRALIALTPDVTASQFELRLRDALAHDTLDEMERETFEAIVGLLQGTRMRPGGAIHQRSIMVLEA